MAPRIMSSFLIVCQDFRLKRSWENNPDIANDGLVETKDAEKTSGMA
jgi:hypothetical protein